MRRTSAISILDRKSTFTVDAYPADVFHGSVGQIRLNATMTQNVVTYTVVVNVDNADGKLDPYSSVPVTQGSRNRREVPAGDKLLPYLTANLQFKVDERNDALLVPNAALHYRPTLAVVAPEYRSAYEQGQRRSTTEEGVAEHATKGRLTRATVWVPDGEWVRPDQSSRGPHRRSDDRSGRSHQGQADPRDGNRHRRESSRRPATKGPSTRSDRETSRRR